MSRSVAQSLQAIVRFKNSQGVDVRGTLVKVTRTLLVFEVYNPYSIVQLSEVLTHVVITRGSREVYNGRATVENLINTGHMLIVSARLHDTWQDLVGVLDSRDAIFTEVERFLSDWDRSHVLHQDYQLVLAELRAFLGETSRWLEQVDLPSEVDGAVGTSTLGDERFHDLLDALQPRANSLFQRFEEAASGLDKEETEVHKAVFQRDLHPLTLSAPFVHRAYTKPLGYAGDYEMVNMMLHNERAGPTTYAQLVNAMYLESGPAAAHRNRIDILVEFLTERAELAAAQERPFRALNIGCGPAQELQRLVRTNPLVERCRFELMDFNDETLAYATEQLQQAGREGYRCDIEFVHRSVHELLKQSVKRRAEVADPVYDVVYCAGLFDYFTDKACSRMLSLFYQWTRPGGVVFATNVHPANPIRCGMEHVAEWYLIYRDEAGMSSLVPGLGHQQVFVDGTGVNVFLRIDKPKDAGA